MPGLPSSGHQILQRDAETLGCMNKAAGSKYSKKGTCWEDPILIPQQNAFLKTQP